MNKPWFLYLLGCADGTLYTGVTTDLQRRVQEHNTGRGARYTAGRRPVWLIGAWQFPDRSRAQQAEARLRRLPPAKKRLLALAELDFEDSPYCGPVPDHFCPRCGSPLEARLEPGEDVPRQVCTVCRRVHYRNATPCAGVLATRNGKLLLVRRGIEPFRGYWDIPGGFLEEGEHPRTGALREVHEETGLEVELGEVFGFYLDRYTHQGEEGGTLNIYFVGRVVGGEEQPADDAIELGWFFPHELPSRVAFVHARLVLEEWTQRALSGEFDVLKEESHGGA